MTTTKKRVRHGSARIRVIVNGVTVTTTVKDAREMFSAEQHNAVNAVLDALLADKEWHGRAERVFGVSVQIDKL